MKKVIEEEFVFLQTDFGLTQRALREDTQYLESTFHNELLAIVVEIDWRELMPDITVKKVMGGKIPPSYRVTKEHGRVAFQLPEILKTQWSKGFSQAFYPAQRLNTEEELTQHLRFVKTCLLQHMEAIVEHFSEILATLEKRDQQFRKMI